GPGQVRNLVVRAVWEGAAVADDERRAPGVGPQDVVQPSDAEIRIGAGARELVVFAGHDRQPGAMGGRVPGRPWEAEAEGVGGRLGQRAVQGLLHVRERAPWVTSRPGGLPAWPIARCSS